MDKETIKSSILRTVNAEIDSWLEEEPTIKDAFEYEKRLFERTLRKGKAMLEHGQGKLSKDRNTKKSVDHFWTCSFEQGPSFKQTQSI